jgi:hypothetical protein
MPHEDGEATTMEGDDKAKGHLLAVVPRQDFHGLRRDVARGERCGGGKVPSRRLSHARREAIRVRLWTFDGLSGTQPEGVNRWQ